VKAYLGWWQIPHSLRIADSCRHKRESNLVAVVLTLAMFGFLECLMNEFGPCSRLNEACGGSPGEAASARISNQHSKCRTFDLSTCSRELVIPRGTLALNTILLRDKQTRNELFRPCARGIEIWYPNCLQRKLRRTTTARKQRQPIRTPGVINDNKRRTQRVSAQLSHPFDPAALSAPRPLNEASGHPR